MIGKLLYEAMSGDLRVKRAANKAIAKEYKMYEGGRISRDRKSPQPLRSPEDNQSTVERIRLLQYARSLEEDFPIATLILDTFDIYALGHIRYQPMTGDRDSNREYMIWLKNWFEECDYTGRFDFQTLARLTRRSKDREGEAGILHTYSGGDYRIQLIEGDRIGNPTMTISPSDTDFNGIVIDQTGRVIRYDIYKRRKDVALYTFDFSTPPQFFSHVFDPFRIDQYHGVTRFKSVITRLQDLKEVMDFSRLNIKYRSSQLPYYKTESGEMPGNPEDVRSAYANAIGQRQKDGDDIDLVNVEGAEQGILKINEGVFEFPNDFPNQQFLPWIQSAIREIMSGVGLSYEFAWNPEAMTGTIGRLIVERNDRVMQVERESQERQWMRVTIRRAIQSAIDKGELPDSPKKFDGEFFYGKRISADYGRDARSDIELIRAGLLTKTEYQHIHGHNPEDVRSVRMTEALDLVEEAKVISEAASISIPNAMNIIEQRYTNPPQSENFTVSKTETVEEIEAEEGSMSESYKPPQSAADAAQRALDRRSELPESKRGMTPTGIARARDIANRRNLSEATVRTMVAWFARHEKTSRNSPNYEKRERAWIAWNGWGGDAARTWAEAIVKRIDSE